MSYASLLTKTRKLKRKHNRQDTHFVRQNAEVLLCEAKNSMKTTLDIRKTIRFEKELAEDIEALSEASPNASDKEKSRQFSKAVRRLCRQALTGSQINDLGEKFEQLEMLRRQIAPIGSNLNQIATSFNTDGHLYGEGLASVHSDLQKSFAEMTDVLRELRNGILRQVQ